MGRAYDANEDLGGMAAGKVGKRHNGGLPEELQIGTGNQGSWGEDEQALEPGRNRFAVVDPSLS